MIRINLLPVRAARKKETLKQQMIVAGVLLVFVIMILVYTNLQQGRKKSRIEADIKKDQAEIARLSTVIGEVGKLKARKKALEDQTRVIEKLENNRAGPVKMMDAFSQVIPQKAWILSMVDSGSGITVDAEAVNEEVISDFMINMEKSACFSEVKLTRITNTGTAGRPKKSFGLSARRIDPCEV
jgi:type IV pilus assembly protein PilN